MRLNIFLCGALLASMTSAAAAADPAWVLAGDPIDPYAPSKATDKPAAPAPPSAPVNPYPATEPSKSAPAGELVNPYPAGQAPAQALRDDELLSPFDAADVPATPPTRAAPTVAPTPVSPPAPATAPMATDSWGYDPMAPRAPQGAYQRFARERSRRMFVRIALGYSYRRALEQHLNSVNPEIIIGVQSQHFASGGHFDMQVGRLSSGLSFQWLHLGPSFFYDVASRVHVGWGLSLGILLLDRASRSSDPMWSFSVGAHVSMDVDLIRGNDGSAFFLQGKLGYDLLTETSDEPVSSLAAGLGLGYRF